MNPKNFNNLQRSFDRKYLSGSIENLINELERVKALYVAEGVPAGNVIIDIELEPEPYEDRESIGVATWVFDRA